MTWRPGLTIEEIGSPQRIAPHSIAVSAELAEGDELLATGRLILLHDPAGNDAWDGTFRLVSYVRAEVELEMVADSLLPEVVWSWFGESLISHDAAHDRMSGTVTASYGKGFGDMTDNEDRAEVELRSSWTPQPAAGAWLVHHLAAWEDLLGMIAGQPALPQGIVKFPGRLT